MAPLSHEIRPVTSCCPPHFGPAVPEVNSVWFKLFIYDQVKSGPPSLLLVKGTRLRWLPKIFEVTESSFEHRTRCLMAWKFRWLWSVFTCVFLWANLLRAFTWLSVKLEKNACVWMIAKVWENREVLNVSFMLNKYYFLELWKIDDNDMGSWPRNCSSVKRVTGAKRRTVSLCSTGTGEPTQRFGWKHGESVTLHGFLNVVCYKTKPADSSAAYKGLFYFILFFTNKRLMQNLQRAATERGKRCNGRQAREKM